MAEKEMCPCCSRKEHDKKMGKMDSPKNFIESVGKVASIMSPAYMFGQAISGGALPGGKNYNKEDEGDDDDKGFMNNSVIGGSNSGGNIKLKANSGKGCKSKGAKK